MRTRNEPRRSRNGRIERLESRVLLAITEPNDTFATAFAVNGGAPIGGAFSFADHIGDGDLVDFYRLNTDGKGPFTATLSGLSGPLNMALIRDSNGNGSEDGGEVVVASLTPGTADEHINV